ncbi:MAG: beta-galactosidase [Caldicoprobacter sp.]|uniref:beta-galactosidase n=1 Tax=Caldicoprobacter sp. TaxID=2004500 RepID=UPI0039C2BFD9
MKYPPINPKFPHFLHGGDYNPDQWKHMPEIWDEDMRLMKLAHCNVMSVGIFSWASLEPEEGKFEFGWLDTIMDKLAENGVYAILATPSGARPAWLAQKYPEVLRVLPNRQRILFGARHNHCYTSPVYREKTRLINQKLAERYKDHPALLAWHVSNEYGGECHCELCQQAFREWLKKKYDNDLDKLNRAWWTSFWSHTYTDWDQIQSPAPHGEGSIHGLNLDWKRFVTHQTVEFMKNEIAPLREITPNVPVTTNFMGTYPGLNYWKFAPELDVISWDNYPRWHGEEPDWELAYKVAFVHDINRSLKGGKPFMLMESTPSMTNWMKVAKLKRPGMHLLSSIQAVAHGSDTVQYFQWRKSRGCVEKFHGAVVDHCGHENTRVFRDVAEVGKVLEKLDPIIGTTVRPEVAIIYDWENRWAIDDMKGLIQDKKDYLLTCQSHYRPFWENGVPVDVIDMDCDFSGYKLLIAPMLYMVRPGVAERIEKFVEEGGTFVTTYWSGIVDENDLCFLGGFPGPLRKVTGIWSEEIDSLYDHDVNHVVMKDGNPLGLKGEYEARELCDLIHAETAEVLATYKDDFYAGRPALTVNSFGKGKAYYIAFRNNGDFLTDFYRALVAELKLKKAVDTELPQGVTAQMRTDGERVFVFILNFVPEERQVDLREMRFKDMITGEDVTGCIVLPPYGVKILERLK